MTIEQTIPLHRLVASKANARQTGKAEGIGELAASIAAHGLRQNLNVMPSGDGKRFEVVAGGRRLKALKQLARAGTLAKDAPIRCLVLDDTDDPAEISLAENVIRAAMHPDDQFEAFRALIAEKGLSAEEVAARFGITVGAVRQRLKLAAVSPRLRALYRKGDMTLDHVMALAISDDHAAQEAAWQNLPAWNRNPSALKDALTSDTVPMTDRLAKFVGVEAYLAAGGTVIRDLFDDEDEGYLSDRALVQNLAIARLEDAVMAVREEGWKWVKPELTRDYAVQYGRLYPQWAEEDEDGVARDASFTSEDKARAGARVTLGYDGTLSVERGLIDPADIRDNARQKRNGKTGEGTAGLSAALVEDLTAHRTAALRIELARAPAIALAATVHAMAATLLYGHGLDSCLKLRALSETLERHTQAVDDSPAHRAMAQQAESWGDRLPGDAADLFAWCLAQPQDVLLELLAYLAALTVDAVAVKHGRGEGLAHADRLAEALSLDMRQWWTASVEGFYQRLPKSMLAQALDEAKVPLGGTAIARLTKAEAARVTAGSLADTGWLPEPLRAPSPAFAG